MSDSENEGGDATGLFDEPAGYYQPEPEATFATHSLRSGKTLSLRLVGKNPLWVRQALQQTKHSLMYIVGT